MHVRAGGRFHEAYSPNGRSSCTASKSGEARTLCGMLSLRRGDRKEPLHSNEIRSPSFAAVFFSVNFGTVPHRVTVPVGRL